MYPKYFCHSYVSRTHEYCAIVNQPNVPCTAKLLYSLETENKSRVMTRKMRARLLVRHSEKRCLAIQSEIGGQRKPDQILIQSERAPSSSPYALRIYTNYSRLWVGGKNLAEQERQRL